MPRLVLKPGHIPTVSHSLAAAYQLSVDFPLTFRWFPFIRLPFISINFGLFRFEERTRQCWRCATAP
eukprot:4309-Rhodomonas_salina.1